MLAPIYQNKCKIPGKNRKCLFHSYKVESHSSYIQDSSYLSKIVGATV